MKLLLKAELFSASIKITLNSMFASPSSRKFKGSQVRTPNTALSSSECSPMIVPSIIRTVSCNIFTLEEVKPEPLEAPTTNRHSSAYIKSAMHFLHGIAAEGVTPARPRCQSTNESPLTHPSQKCKQAIDLTEWPSRLSPGPLKDQINKEFSEKHPLLDKRLTLSKIVNLREKVLTKIGIDVCTTALAWTYFMELVEGLLITKANRKVYAAACVLLAVKFNEDLDRKELKRVVKALGWVDSAEGFVKTVQCGEFKVLRARDFCLIPNAIKYNQNLAQAKAAFNSVLKKV